MHNNAFSSLDLPKSLQDNLNSLKYEQMTEIQAQSLPHTMAGKDLIGQAKTGSGKTLAFVLPILTKLNPKFFGVQALILCPTRELGAQVAEEARRLARMMTNIKVLTLCGGQPIGPQIGSLEHGAHIIVGTPGRVKDHLRKGTLKIDQVETFVLDEADRMLDMGFIDDMVHIAEHIENKHQTLLFSATFPEDIKRLSQQFQKDPLHVKVESQHKAEVIEQHFYEVDADEKMNVLLRILSHFTPEHCVVFCNTKKTCAEVLEQLRQYQYMALNIQGDMDQRERDQALVRFANRSAAILVATDVAARGIDVDDLDMVINFDMPRDPEVYVHRIGRTGRAGKRGVAASLLLHYEAARHDLVNQANDKELNICQAGDLPSGLTAPEKPAMVTLAIDGGKKNKVRPGDILGALTGTIGLKGDDVGKIAIFPFVSYVAVKRESARQALQGLQKQNIKGRKFKVRRL